MTEKLSTLYPSPLDSKHWEALSQAAQTQTWDLSKLSQDNQDILHIEQNGISFDATRNLVTPDIIDHLIGLAEDQQLEQARDAMFNGEPINIFENRAVLHTALRAPKDHEILLNNKNIVADVHEILNRMRGFVNSVHDDGSITDVVSIGIGGSYLGPEMVCRALRPYQDKGIHVHFVANIDGHDLAEKLDVLDPSKTLFLVASKTFTTQETMTNAHSARKWLIKHLGEEKVEHHFAALSTNIEAAQKFGIHPDNVFPFWDWVGGRFSVWSSIGLPIALAIGFERFREFLDGGLDMDMHFRQTPLNKNIPALFGLIGVWNRNFLGASSLAVLPYDQRLEKFSAFLQQLDMESNGKSVDRNNKRVSYDTGPIVFGEPGTNGQHAFYQLIHQGTELIPCDFIASIKPSHDLKNHHDILISHLLAQSEALMKGRNLEEAGGNPQKVFEGNKPCNLLLIEELSPFHLGQLIALYEHKIFVQGIIWNLNSFDQWGVELGKEIAGHILSTMGRNEHGEIHPTTATSLSKIQSRSN